MEAAEFYTGIVAEVHAALRSTHFDAGPYETFVRTHGQPAFTSRSGR